MSTGFGVNKGKDGKYNTLNLTSYKGRSTDPSKPSGTSSMRHGLQSLGKIPSTRRVPPPASIPSLKSENLGNDPNVNLVPKDGSGWASSKTESHSQSPAPQVSAESQQQRQPAAGTTSNTAAQQAAGVTGSSSRNQNSSVPQGGNVSQPMWGASRYTQPGSKVSAAPDGARGRGTTPFSDDFPTLGDTHKDQPGGNPDAKPGEQQYGPGPSLRPQNVASWREGGGRNVAAQASPTSEGLAKAEDGKQMDSVTPGQLPSRTPPHSSYPYDGPASDMAASQMAARQMGQPPVRPQQGFVPNMMPQYQMYGYPGVGPAPGGPPGGRYGVGMQPRVPFNLYGDPRYRGMMMPGQMQQQPPQHQQPPNQGKMGGMRPVLPKSNAKKADRQDDLDDDDGGWATMHGEVDYSEKLVFSDDEDTTPAPSGKSAQDSRADKRDQKEPPSQPSQAWGPQQTSVPDNANVTRWSQPAPQQYMMPFVNKQQQQQPQVYDKRLPPQGQMYPGPPHQGQMFRQRFVGPVPGMMQTRSSPSGEDIEHRRKTEKEEALERAKKRKDEEEKRMQMEQSGGDPNELSRYMQGSEAVESSPWAKPQHQDHFAAAAAARNRRTESESSDDRRPAWQERPPGDGFGGSRSVPHQSSQRNLPPRLAQQRQERFNQRMPASGQSYDQPWSNQPQPIRPSIMKRERRESEESDDHHKGSRSRQVSEGSQPYSTGRATPDDDRLYGGQEISRRDDRRLFDAGRSSENHSPGTDSKLWDAGPSKPVKRQVSRDSAMSNDSRRGSLKSLLTRSDSGSRVLTKRGSNQSEKSEPREDQRQQEAVKPRRMDSKVKLRDFRVESDQENDPSATRRQDGKSKKPGPKSAGSHPFTSEPKKWNNDKGNKPIATVSPSTTTNSVTTSSRNSSKKKDPITKSITRDELPPEESERDDRHHSASDYRRDNRSRKAATYKDRTYGDHRQYDSDRDSPDFNEKPTRKPLELRQERAREYSDNFSERGDAVRGPAGQRNRPGDRSRQNDNKHRRDVKDQRREPRKEYSSEKGRSSNAQHGKRPDSSKPIAPEISSATDKGKSQVTEIKAAKNLSVGRQKPAAPPSTNIWEERAKQMQTKLDTNLTYIPTEEDRKRTLKETAPVKSSDVDRTPEEKINSRSPHIEDADNFNKDYSNEKADKKSRYRENYRPPSNQGRSERRGSDRSFPPDRYERRGGRGGRGRSRGARGRGAASSEKFASSAPSRGRGPRRSGARSAPSRNYSRSGPYSSAYHGSKFNENTDSYEDDDYSSESDDDTPFTTRRRKKASTDESYSDHSASEHTRGHAQPKTIIGNPSPLKDKFESTYTARGEPSRRGRGRGLSTRGRGRSSGASKSSYPTRNGSGRSRKGEQQLSDDPRNSKNAERGLSAPGADDGPKNTSRSSERRKRKPKDQPPRFKNTQGRRQAGSETKTTGPTPNDQQAAAKSDADTPQPASEWETTSEDNPSDNKKLHQREPRTDTGRNTSNQRLGNQQDRPAKYNDKNKGKPIGARMDSQVYVVHSVDYNDPSAIEGAMRGNPSSAHHHSKKAEEDKQAKNKKLFRRFDLHNYAGVINVDDIPEVSQRAKESDAVLQDEIFDAGLPSPKIEVEDEEDGFTPVLSKRSQKKKQEKSRKKDAEQQIMEIFRKQKVEHNKQARQKIFTGKGGNGVKSGSSGSVKQSIPTTTVASIASDIWLEKIDTWEPKEATRALSDAGKEAQVSHDSGVESSVPSSQRNSPGTESKLSFSHFSTTMTSTSVITSICNHEVPQVGRTVQHTNDLGAGSQGQLPQNDAVINAFLDSPSRTNPMGAIGNERIKSHKRSDSVENITSLYHQESKAISFIADDSDKSQGQQTTQSASLFSVEDLRTSSSPFVDPGFKTPDFTESQLTPDTPRDPGVTSNFGVSDFASPGSAQANNGGDILGSSLGSSGAQSRNPHQLGGFTHIPSLQSSSHSSYPDSATSEPSSHPTSTVLGHGAAGAFPEPEPLEDMTLTPQTSNNPNVTVSSSSSATQGPLDHPSSSIPAPIPMPPAHHQTQTKQGRDCDTKNGIRQTRDIARLTPTSPSIDFSIKMEFARKAWENMPESSAAAAASNQSLSNNPNENHSFHTATVSSASIGESQDPRTSISSLGAAQAEQNPSLSSSSKEVDDSSSWKSSLPQTATSQVPAQEQQERVPSPVVSSEAPISIHVSTGNAGSVMTSHTPSQQPVMPSQYGSNPYMYLDYSAQRLPGGQSAIYHQPISTTSLANNLQHMQQIYNSVPPEFAAAQSLYSATGYNSLTQQHQTPGYSTQAYLASNAVGSPGVKPTTPNSGVQIKSNQHQQHQQQQQQTSGQAAMRSGMIPSFGAASGIPGMAQQTNLGSTQLSVPRPHGGAPSPAQQVLVPMVDQSRIATQGNSLVNQPLNIAPRAAQSSSFYSHQTSGNFYPQHQPQSMRQATTYQPSGIPGGAQQITFQQGIYQTPIKPATPPNQLGLDHTGSAGMTNLQGTYPPIAPPNQRPRSDDYSSYYQIKPSSFAGGAAKMQSQTQSFGGLKASGIAAVSYGATKPSQSLYIPGSSTSQDPNSSLQKYSMAGISPGAGKPPLGQIGSDWGTATSQINRPSSVHGLLSRPFSSSDSINYQPSPTMPQQQPNYMLTKSQDIPTSNTGLPFQMHNQQQQPPYNQSPSWNAPKMVSPHAGSAPHSGPGILGKAPRNMVPSSMMPRFPLAQQFQQSNVVSPQQMSAYRSPMSFPMKQMPPSGMKMQQTQSSVSISQYTPMADALTTSSNTFQPQQKAGGIMQGNSKQQAGNTKTPPVPTLVRGAGSNLAGKKPTFMPEEVIKSNQASERASLLQSLSSFFPDKPKPKDVEEVTAHDDKGTDWSTQVANSDPLPKRKPGMRHPGVDRRKLNQKGSNGGGGGGGGGGADQGDKSKRSGPIGGKSVKRSSGGGVDEAAAGSSTGDAVAAINSTTKKLTLADTRPKQGQIAQIK